MMVYITINRTICSSSSIKYQYALVRAALEARLRPRLVDMVAFVNM
jgi:hypothetical protein